MCILIKYIFIKKILIDVGLEKNVLFVHLGIERLVAEGVFAAAYPLHVVCLFLNIINCFLIFNEYCTIF